MNGADVTDRPKLPPRTAGAAADAARRGRTVRLAVVLAFVAAAFYFGFIATMAMRAR